MRKWFAKNALWIVGIGLMLASSGIDGVYMASWMPISILGFILNTVADTADMVLAHKYGKLQRKKSVQKRKLSMWLLAGEICAIGYSWFFSWLQLRIVLQALEPVDYKWIAPIAAGFIPVLLFFLGFAQALDDTSQSVFETDAKENEIAAQPEPEPVPAVKLNARQIAMIETLRSDAYANYTQLGKAHDVSRTTAKSDTETLIAAGAVSRNGRGWEVRE